MTDFPPTNALLSAWNQTRQRLGNAPAIFDRSGAVLRSFEEVEAESHRLASRLAQFAKGSVVGVQIGNSASWPAVLVALFRAGLVVLPLGRHIESAELESALATCRASALVTADSNGLHFAEKYASAPTWSEPVPHLLKLTSGTTSAPRAVRFRAHQLVADCENICATMGITEHDVNFGVIPFSHSYGFSNLLTPLLMRGVPLVASEDRMPRAILHDLARSGATVFPGMPVFFQKLIELENVSALPRLRICISAGAPLSIGLAERFHEKFGLKIHPFYGASECGGISYDALGETNEDGFVGTPMHGVKVERNDVGEVSAITIRSEAVGDGYFPEPDEDTLGRGSFTPSDLVRSSERGMSVVGRASDVINVAGRKLNPGEIEQRLARCPAIRQVVVFGVPSTLRGEEPIVCGVLAPGSDEAEVRRFCHDNLSAWQVPKDVWILEEIPTNERGKFSRRALAEMYRARKLG